MSKIKLIREKYQYVDKQTGEIKDRTLNIPHYFCEIEFIYSSSVDGGKVKFSAEMQKLYCYVSDWEKSGGICFETQTKLSKVCGCSRKTVNELIGLMIKIGLLEEVGERIPKRPLKLRALPLTDAHITPPGESSLSDLSEAEEAQEQPKGHKQPSFDVLDDWDTPLPWETEETPVSSSEKVANDNEEDVLENFASLIIKQKNTRTGGASFIEFANSLAYRHGLKRPNGIEAYFSKHYPNVYEDFDIPF
ncbi:transcriptional regulator [Escherichia coli]|uniref:transcriptional regulator n=1 Tax=Escherichia coli TaxID=562 RepID=UPI000CE68C3E|nr:transcriptional regulator [Escherichia coli]ELT3574345.1 transcriptional regulator [Escherichia coli]ELT3625154.1 transcriptional regulator [Escherichia coli]ELT3782153.1 transcriptional regulator [Escherichia coli]ELT3798702.1 transcriptional regulator [Escherichia coli]MCK3316552.1 helix-turn-helix domain-containing protein [Escherichia coli]